MRLTRRTRAGSASTDTSRWCWTRSSWASPRDFTTGRTGKSVGIGPAAATRRRGRKCGTPCELWTIWKREPDVDSDRMGVTGLSGGGVISWCLGAADERVKVVVPVCQSGSIEHVVTDRATDGHCDCAFWINYYRWCWPDIGALIAPRSLLIASGSEDILWRPYGYRDVAHRIRHQYAALGADSHFDLVEDLTPHGYTPKLRRAIFTWFNTHLKNDPTPVTDDVTDFVEPEENLLVFGGKLPEQDEMSRIDKLLVQRPELPTITDEAAWRAHQKSRDQATARDHFSLHLVGPRSASTGFPIGWRRQERQHVRHLRCSTASTG